MLGGNHQEKRIQRAFQRELWCCFSWKTDLESEASHATKRTACGLSQPYLRVVRLLKLNGTGCNADFDGLRAAPIQHATVPPRQSQSHLTEGAPRRVAFTVTRSQNKQPWMMVHHCSWSCFMAPEDGYLTYSILEWRLEGGRGGGFFREPTYPFLSRFFARIWCQIISANVDWFFKKFLKNRLISGNYLGFSANPAKFREMFDWK